MEAEKVAITEFLARGGHHDTEIHKAVAPAVVHEVVNPTRHETITTAIEKEVHQDHYHTTVQPINHQEVMPEVHTHNLKPVDHINFNHDNTDANLARLAEEAAKYKDDTVVAETVNTSSTVPTVAAEHIHHHVHEIIQPVIHKETIQPTVIHTTIPIHEVHHNLAQHHVATELPALSMEEYLKQGGALAGREVHVERLTGEPAEISAVAVFGSLASKKRDSGIGSPDSDKPIAANRNSSEDSLASEPLTQSPQESKAAEYSGNPDARAAAQTAAAKNRSSDSVSSKSSKRRSLRERLDPRIHANGEKKSLGIFH